MLDGFKGYLFLAGRRQPASNEVFFEELGLEMSGLAPMISSPQSSESLSYFFLVIVSSEILAFANALDSMHYRP
jgi:hypothetical protein